MLRQQKLESDPNASKEEQNAPKTPLQDPLPEKTLTVNEYRFAVLYNFLKEFVCTIMLLILYSRLGSYSFSAIALVIFVMLVVFAFPFMNPYLYFHVAIALQQGNPPEYRPTEPNFWIKWRIVRKAVVVVLLITAQLCGAVTAAYMRKYFTDTYGVEFMTPDATNGIAAYRFNTTSTITTFDKQIRWTFEEFFAVILFLVGVTHILDSVVGMITHGTEQSNKKQDDPKPEENKYDIFNIHFPASAPPVVGIFYIAVLIAGLSLMFPTAHFSIATSLYLYIVQTLTENDTPLYKNTLVDTENGEVGYRILGGIFGTLMVMGYYQLIYKMVPGYYKIARIIRLQVGLGTEYKPPSNLYPFSKKKYDVLAYNKFSSQYLKL